MFPILKNLVADLISLPVFEKSLSTLQAERRVEISSAVGSLRSVLAAQILLRLKYPVLWLFDTQEHANEAKIDLEHLLPVKSSALFPRTRKSRWGHDDVVVVSQQAEALAALQSQQRKVYLVACDALQTRIKTPAQVHSHAIHLHAGSEFPFEDLLRKLARAGFEREPVTEKPGDYSVRGGIVDIFLFTKADPVRVEFWGNTIESIREFDYATQRSSAELDEVFVMPKPEAGESTNQATLIDFLPSECVILLDEAPAIQQRLLDARADSGSGNGSTAESDPWREFLAMFEAHRQVFFTPFKAQFASAKIDMKARSPKSYSGNLKLLVADLVRSNGAGLAKNYFLCESRSHAQKTRELFNDYELTEQHVHVIGLNLSKGFCLPEHNVNVYTDHEFYGRIRRHRGRRRFKDSLTLRQLKTLSNGDFIVHADHGIGTFVRLEKIVVGGSERECLLLEYRDGDKLYVPIEKMDRVQKYAGKDGAVPKIHKLGSPEWQKTKKRTKAKLREIAKELVQLYSLRKTQEGFAFSPDSTWQRELEASFPFEETPDQNKAVVDVKQDMERNLPMDRLICGDVGYGKTEVAIRAAFKAVQDGKQVALLVPTTILAEQHYLTFGERLNHFPVKIEVLSRFRTSAQQKKIVSRLKDGRIDIVIGTHRLLSKDVEFKNLGLLIIDEEQRFGVRHKEKLKQLRVNVDVLALSATPIPRTLHMSLIGVRDMSQINTPPRDRLPVYTETMEFTPRAIREAILFELQRGGQVFFVHNRVETIHNMAAKLADIVPEADIAVGHGQMRESELEKVMLDFMQNKFQVLVSTMIIESGLDLPNVNTIFINRADRFGLSQLYQLRGRVGRSSHKAYCYLLVPPLHSLKRDAIKRLETIEEFTDLGSGIQIALRDLEIRGAGNLIGAEQSGFIEAVGFETYIKILEESIREIKRSEEQRAGATEPKLADECRIEADSDAYLPQKYVEIPSERLDIYRRIAHASEAAALDQLLEEVRDRFGRLPEEARNLFHLAKAKVLGRKAGLRRIRVSENKIFAEFAEKIVAGPPEEFKQWIGFLLERSTIPVEFVQEKELKLKLVPPAGTDKLACLIEFLDAIASAGKVGENVAVQ